MNAKVILALLTLKWHQATIIASTNLIYVFILAQYGNIEKNFIPLCNLEYNAAEQVCSY